MKIVHIIWAMSIGGTESMLVDIINEQSKIEEVHLIIVNRIEAKALTKNISKKVIVHRINRMPGSRNILDAIFSNIKLRLICPDIVHCHNHELVKYFPFVRHVKTKLFLTIHTTGITILNLYNYHKLFAISDSIKKDVLVRSKLLPVTVHNGVRTDKIKKKEGYSFSIFKMVQVGRLFQQQKGQDIVLQAINYLVYSKNISNISVDFIGDGPSKEPLLSLAKKLNVLDFCNFVGLKEREWIYEHLCDYDLLLQPSRQEGFGLTVAEALAAKIPVLISNLEGPMEIIDNGKFGYYFTSENSKELANKIFEIQINYTSKQIKEKIEKGYAKVVQSYDIKQTALTYLKYYMNNV